METLRRAVHFVPGANDKMLGKSIDLAADALVLDLEDSVTPDNKASARKTVTEWLQKVDFKGRERMVRMNPLETPWGVADLEATMAGRPDSYMIPKVRTFADVEKIDSILSGLEKQLGYPERSVKLLLLATETPQGLLNIKDLGLHPRVDSMSWGAEDLSAAIGARRNRDERGEFLEVFRYSRPPRPRSSRSIRCSSISRIPRDAAAIVSRAPGWASPARSLSIQVRSKSSMRFSRPRRRRLPTPKSCWRRSRKTARPGGWRSRFAARWSTCRI
jgi:hypothetical protein